MYNLTAVRDPSAMVAYHILDSLAVLPWLPDAAPAGAEYRAQPPARVLDIGSGAGLPGIPLALARPDLGFTLLDSSGKRTRFMQQMVADLRLANVTVARARVERHRPDPARPYCRVTARAYASLCEFAAAAVPLCAPEGRLLALKGVYPDAELAALAVAAPPLAEPEQVVELRVPGVDAARHLAVLRPSGDGR